MFQQSSSIISLVIADPDLMWMTEIAEKLSTHPVLKVVGYAQSGEAAIQRAASTAADALLINYSLPDMTATEVKKKLEDASPGTSVFVIAPIISAQLVMEAKSRGIVEVFDRNNYSAAEIAEKIVRHVEELRNAWARAATEHGIVGKGTGPIGARVKVEQVIKPITQTVILTHSPKGGVGKSTIAVNLATAIKRSPILSGARVALLDFDCEFGNLATLCALDKGLVLSRNISLWEHVPEDISPSDIEELLVPSPSGIMVLPAPYNPAVAAKIKIDTADKVLRVLKRYFGIIVIDGGPKISEVVDAAIQHATHILLISTPEGQAVENLARIVYFLTPDQDNPSKPDTSAILRKMFLVVNRVANRRGDLSPAEVSKLVGRPLIAEIPEDEAVAAALHTGNGKQAVEMFPDSPFSIAIRKLANDLTGAYPSGIAGADVQTQSKQKRKKFFGLF